MDAPHTVAHSRKRVRKRRRSTSSGSASSPGADGGGDDVDRSQRPTPSKLPRQHAGKRNGHAVVAKGETDHAATLVPALKGGAHRDGGDQAVRHSSIGATPAVAAVSGAPRTASQVEPRRSSSATGAACAITAPPAARKQGVRHISSGAAPAVAAVTSAAHPQRAPHRPPTVATGVACAITAPPSAPPVGPGHTNGDEAAAGSGGGSSGGGSSGRSTGASTGSSEVPRGTQHRRQQEQEQEQEQEPVVPVPESARRSPPRRRGRPRLPLPDALRNADASAEDIAAALKLERRRRQNRESAANSRKRSKRLVDAAVKQVEALRNTNTALRKQYQELTQRAREAIKTVAAQRARSAQRASAAASAAAQQADNDASARASLAAAQQAAATAVAPPPRPQSQPLSGMGMGMGMGMHFPLGQMAMGGLPPGMDVRQLMAMQQLQPMQNSRGLGAGLGTTAPWMPPIPSMPMLQGMAQGLPGMPFNWPAASSYLQPQRQLQPQLQPPVSAALPWQPPPVMAASAPSSTSHFGRGHAASGAAVPAARAVGVNPLARHSDTASRSSRVSGRTSGSGSSWGSGTKNSDTSGAPSREAGALAALFLMLKPPAPSGGKGASGSRR